MFYVETTEEVTKESLKDAFKQAAVWASGLTEVPGSKKRECGNYKSHNLSKAVSLLNEYADNLN